MSEDTQIATDNKPDIKPRSRIVTDGIHAAPARGMFRAVGMGDDDFAKPQIGVASSWNEITPCNLSLNRLAQGAKEGVHAGGGFPMQFGTISVSDGISMGHEGMHFSLVSREVIADSVETVMQAERIDGSVLLAGCDKSLRACSWPLRAWTSPAYSSTPAPSCRAGSSWRTAPKRKSP
jgi:dihydroxy-acid dehydratase